MNVAAAVVAVLSAASASAAETGSAAALEEVLVFGRGQSRQVAEITAIEISKEAPGTSALKAIAKLPGVSFQSADPYGAYEWSARISVRGFNQNQLGFTLDGVPLGDMSYGNHNGLHISRAISSENIGSALLSQGAGSLETASSSNLGGTLQFFSANPTEDSGINVAMTGGEDSTVRGFLKFNSGELGSARTRMSLSYTNQNSEKWKGTGDQKQEMINFKLVQPVGEGSLTAFFNWSDRQENDYQDMSYEMLNRLGYSWDNQSHDYALHVQVADIYQAGGTYPGGPYPAPILTPDDTYANAAGLRKDELAGATLNMPLGENTVWDTTLYRHQNDGQGIWFTPYRATPVGAADGSGGTIANPAPISVRTTEYDIDRVGLTSALTFELGQHTVKGGLWYETNDFNQARRFYGLRRSSPQRNSLSFMREPFRTDWQYGFTTDTTMFFLQDTWAINDALRINFGFKSLEVKNQARKEIDIRSSPGPSGQIKADESFLPQVGFNYVLNDQNEVFGSYTENMRAFIGAVTGSSPFATTAVNFAALQASGGLSPETSKTYELGWRYNTGTIQAVATVYMVDFKDRLLVNTIGAGIVGNPTALQNVGDVETQGAELGMRWAFMDDWNWYNSVSYNQSEYQDDVVSIAIVGGVPVTTITPTGGKTVVDAPEELLKSELGYDNGKYFGKLGVDYAGKRYFTYTNDLVAGDGKGYVSSYTVLNLGLGYRLQDIGVGKNITVQANVSNLTEEDYVSTIGSNGFGNRGDNQTFQVGSPRQFFLTLSGQF
ncbi:MAG: TonB-dependent receptor [Steroidobacteraceae bacterium]